jgi:hypothetical protein
MTFRGTWWSRSGVYLFSVILAGIVVNLSVETPNVTGGGAAMMVGIIFLAVLFRAIIVFFLTRWDKRNDKKQNGNLII